ncbi:MAG: ribonuclease Z [Candidatus Heimdallarchaeota archaeon]|nr:ribonuclease Z [Candidatus Heimdallarchaeota archaeon]
MSGSNLTVTFLGTGSAIPPENRQQVSCALRHAEGLVIFDCGEGTQYSLRKFRIRTRKEIVISLSHLHSDHFLGLPGLLASFQLLNREDPIHIVGPTGTSLLVNNLMIANFIKVEYEIKIHELNDSDQFRGKGYVIKAVSAKHEARALSFIWQEDDRPGKVNIEKIKQLGIPSGPLVGQLQKGKKIEWKNQTIDPDTVIGARRRGRIIAYSGDTAPNTDFESKLDPCDLLIHEATYPDGMEELAEERGHSTISQAVNIAKNANVNLVILTHFSPRITEWDEEIEKAISNYEPVMFAYEGLKVIVPLIEE